MIILAKEYTDFIKRIKNTINNTGKSCSVCTLLAMTNHNINDVFGFYDCYIDENRKGEQTKELYYAFIELPKWWAVRADGVDGAVYDNNKKKASIYFNEPIEKRNVKLVEWHDEENRVYRKDYYNKMGYKYCTENVRNNKIILREFFDSEGNLVLLEQVMSQIYTVFEKNDIKKVCTSFAELFTDIMIKAEITEDKELLQDNKKSTITNDKSSQMQESVIEEVPNISNNYLSISLIGVSTIFFILTIIFSIIFTKHQLKRRKKLSKK